jgi:two-component system response regulator RegX3
VALRELTLAKSNGAADSDVSKSPIGEVEGQGELATHATSREGAGPAELVPGPLQGATTVLVVENDDAQALASRSGLEREGFAVTWARDGVAGLEAFHAMGPDVVIVDAMLPGLSGIDLTRLIRRTHSSVPVIVVSSRSEEIDVVLAMEIGADDFLAKPYRMRVLVARIRALLRRSSPLTKPDTMAREPMKQAVAVLPIPEESIPRTLVVDDLQLDPDRHEVFIRGERIELTRQEFRLLEELLARAGMLLLRQTLLERIWGSEFDGNGKILSTLINRLRARVEDDPDNPVRIVTIRGLGYRYERQQPKAQVSEPPSPGSAGHRHSRPHNVDYRSVLLLSEIGAPITESGHRAWE